MAWKLKFISKYQLIRLRTSQGSILRALNLSYCILHQDLLSRVRTSAIPRIKDQVTSILVNIRFVLILKILFTK